MIAHPDFVTRASTIHAHEIVMTTAQNNWARMKWPVSRLRRAPPTGDPMSMPIPAMLKLIPRRVPTLLRSFDRERIALGGSETNEPEKKPYRIANTTMPPVS